MPQRRSLILLALCVALQVLPGCNQSPLPPPGQSGKLVVAIRPGPATWYPGPDNAPLGFDHDLLARFAAEQKLQLVAVEVGNRAELHAKLLAGQVHLGAGGLALPASANVAPEPKDVRKVEHLRWTKGMRAVEPVIIFNADSFRPKGWGDLAGAPLAYVEGSAIDHAVAQLRADQPDILWQAAALPSVDALIAAVSDGSVDYAIVPSTDAASVRNIFFNFDLAFTAEPKSQLAWVVAPESRHLLRELDAFLARMRQAGTLARYADRYFAGERLIERINASVFAERLKTSLPQYRRLLHEAQAATGIDWRLLAAIAYQESQWDPAATSETGVRGFMQITEETARHLGIADRLDPAASTLGAARYLKNLKSRLPPRIAEPDRTWMALAAFNIGLGHLEDARKLAQKQKRNPDLWSDVQKMLPLLALPEYYESAKGGYARGGMPVVFVDRVRAFYDILARQEPAYQPPLRASHLVGK